MERQWMIYGANGYTGELVARLAVERGERPVLAGRDPAAVGRLATELDLPSRPVRLSDAAGLRRALDGIAVVAHCAGPFDRTARPMVEACLASGTHYLDITGELDVLAAIYGRHDAARAAGVVLLPDAGFDVVPTDCLAALLAAALPTASSLELAVLASGGPSRGTAKSGLRLIARGGVRRVDGRLQPCPLGEPRRVVPFPSGDREVGAFPLADVESGYRSTGIPNITVYTRLPRPPAGAGRVTGALARGLQRLGPTRAIAGRLASRGVRGPDATRRARSRCEIWGQVREPGGQTRSATLTGPNGYALTADAVVRAVAHLRSGVRPAGQIEPGAHTPSSALGAGFVGELDGVLLGAIAVG